jgi:hypothetical protein
MAEMKQFIILFFFFGKVERQSGAGWGRVWPLRRQDMCDKTDWRQKMFIRFE